ncbi:E3 ubiquitin-protein ligase RMA1H1-like isoform X2 [Cornus florida]|nr:E3 ubiquitin-protein ligase RMA1H1-like isoform X2 [Cornus florida]
MALDHYLAKEWKSISAAASDLDNSPGCFDCNICLDFAHDPVVTLCGHLYCWPCIYKWFYFQSDSLASEGHPQCPVCKAEISHNTVVPLYGRGQTPPEAELDAKASPVEVAIPPRPPACGTKILTSMSQHSQQLEYHNPYQNQQYSAHPYSTYEEDSAPSPYNLGMYGEMVYARVFGNSQSLYTYPNSYQLEGSRSPRLRRQEMQAARSLNRISIFLLCCFLLCLLLF